MNNTGENKRSCILGVLRSPDHTNRSGYSRESPNNGMNRLPASRWFLPASLWVLMATTCKGIAEPESDTDGQFNPGIPPVSGSCESADADVSGWEPYATFRLSGANIPLRLAGISFLEKNFRCEAPLLGDWGEEHVVDYGSFINLGVGLIPNTSPPSYSPMNSANVVNDVAAAMSLSIPSGANLYLTAAPGTIPAEADGYSVIVAEDGPSLDVGAGADQTHYPLVDTLTSDIVIYRLSVQPSGATVVLSWGNGGDTSKDANLTNVLIHELGHGLGRDHNTYEASSVYTPAMVGGQGYGITPADAVSIQFLYDTTSECCGFASP